ncbi:MAG: aldolase [Rhodobiaceae bacterium]|nr:aldolase [Rhodobiaceae bacterium]
MTGELTSDTIHASAVKLPLGGVLLLGPSGSGKSSLALQLIDHYGGQLTADDRVCLTVIGNNLQAAPPDNLAGLIELRGLGIITVPHQNAMIDLAVELVTREQLPRLAKAESFSRQGINIPLIRLHGHDMTSAGIIARALEFVSEAGLSLDGVYR